MPPTDDQKDTPAVPSKLTVDDTTDYEALETSVDLLGFVLTDLKSYTSQENGAEKLDYFAQSLGRLTAKVGELIRNIVPCD